MAGVPPGDVGGWEREQRGLGGGKERDPRPKERRTEGERGRGAEIRRRVNSLNCLRRLGRTVPG